LGAFSSLAITVVSPSIPREFTVSQNYPNPFNPSTKIDFFVAAKDNIKLVIYDLLGRQIRTLVDGIVAAGPQSVSWDGRDTQGTTVSSGVYFYCVEHRSQRLAKQMMLIK
jgi:flagellar hook assembly protein FlgD